MNSPSDELTPALATLETAGAVLTEAKARERERRKAQKAAGKSHVVKHCVKEVEAHYDGCGEDVSSLICKDQTLDTWWS